MSEPSLFTAVRMAVMRHNRKHGTTYRVSVDADQLTLVNDSEPNHEQFVGYLQRMPEGSSFTIGPEYADRFEQFKAWTLAESEESSLEYDAVDESGSLVISKT